MFWSAVSTTSWARLGSASITWQAKPFVIYPVRSRIFHCPTARNASTALYAPRDRCGSVGQRGKLPGYMLYSRVILFCATVAIRHLSVSKGRSIGQRPLPLVSRLGFSNVLTSNRVTTTRASASKIGKALSIAARGRTPGSGHRMMFQGRWVSPASASVAGQIVIDDRQAQTSAHDTPDQRVSSPITARIPAQPVACWGLPSRIIPNREPIGQHAPLFQRLKGSVSWASRCARSASEQVLGQDHGRGKAAHNRCDRVASPDRQTKLCSACVPSRAPRCFPRLVAGLDPISPIGNRSTRLAETGCGIAGRVCCLKCSGQRAVIQLSVTDNSGCAGWDTSAFELRQIAGPRGSSNTWQPSSMVQACPS